MQNNQLPIGIFDSGIGGLTVARAVKNTMPNEAIVYFGDTAHLPYGDKSTAAIQAYAIKICELLLKQPVKAILIACNSASAAAFDLVREYVASRAVVFNVIDPVVQYVAMHHPKQHIGLIGTKQTINSNVYKKKIDQTGLGIKITSKATPLLATMIEEGFFNNNISEQVIKTYLDADFIKPLKALILGCTHYPLIKNQIETIIGNQINVIDASVIVAQHISKSLSDRGLLNPEDQPILADKFFVSDITESFRQSTSLFFNQQVYLESYPLWE